MSPHIVESECQLEPATLVYMCDAFDPINEDACRDMMRFHRKLAPFKVTFAASATTASVSKELTDLALVLARKIRKAGIPCLLLPDIAKTSLESNFSRADAMGIPYTVVMNDKTLTDGIIGIRSRDTTLKVGKEIILHFMRITDGLKEGVSRYMASTKPDVPHLCLPYY